MTRPHVMRMGQRDSPFAQKNIPGGTKVSEGRCGARNSWVREGAAYFGTQAFGNARRPGDTAAHSVESIRLPAGKRNLKARSVE